MMLWLTKAQEPRESRLHVRENARLSAHCRGVLVHPVLKGVKKHLVTHQFGVSGLARTSGCIEFRLKGLANLQTGTHCIVQGPGFGS